MLALAVDTTSAHGSIALLDDDALRGMAGFRTAQPRHAESLLPSVDDLLAHVGAELADVDGFAVAVGPGSFTGLRIGIAAVEGLAYSLDKPAVGVSALDATAFRYRHRRGLLVAMLEAYRGEVYGATYRSDGEAIEPASEPVCMPPKEFLESIPATPELIAGTATVSYRGVVDAELPERVTVAEPSFFIAEEVARLGAKHLEAGQRAPLGGLDALYIRPSEAERNLGRGNQP
jgi:tRNA threonylcarbamoyladenosine biosynthesis protein TsaB